MKSVPVKLTGSNKTKIHDLITSLITEINSITNSPESSTCIIVEGANDENALRSLGIKGVVFRVYGNQKTIDDIERQLIQHHFTNVIILTDFDLEGQELARKLKKYLEPKIKILGLFRKRLKKSLGGWVEVIEAIPNFFSRVSS